MSHGKLRMITSRQAAGVSPFPYIEIPVYPDDCDAYGHLNQASLLRMFERARWDVLAGGPGADVFTRNDTWPAVRKTTLEYRQQALPGDRLRFTVALVQHGHTSFTLRQSAHRARDGALVGEGEFVFVCIGQDGRPVAVPAEVSRFFGHRPSRLGATQQFGVRGVSLAVDAQGDGDAILFLNAFPLDRTMWRPLASVLTGWRRIMPDYRGFGESETPDAGYTIDEYADDAAALLGALRVERAVVCGISMGGYVAFDLWRRHPERVRALVLINTRATPDDGDAKAQRDATITRVRRDGPGALAESMTPSLLAPTTMTTMPDVVSQVKATIGRAHTDGVAGALAAMRDRLDATPLLSTITVPTLVIAGHEDQLIPAAAQRAMADAIPGAHFTVLPGAGHLAPLEQPVNTGRLVGEFLESLR